MKIKKSSTKILAISLVLCLISMIGAMVVQTSGGDVTVKDLRWETPSGHMMSALLFVPKNATKETPAPAIVTSHGWFNNREMQDMNYVEYARRGYVVISIDMYGHGNSDAVKPEEWAIRGTGMYDAVELIADLPYVDKDRIGVTGHSNGARASNWSVLEDNKRTDPLIAAVLLVANDAMYTNDPHEPLYWLFRNDAQQYANVYGTRDVGIVAAQYDEFFFRSNKAEGGYTLPREYIDTKDAQSFLNFGVDPNTVAEKRTSYTIYESEVDGVMASRVIYNPHQTHAWNTISASVAKSSLSFFEHALGAPNPIDPSKQVWQYKEFFTLLGLVGFVMFIVSFTKWLLQTAPFASLKSEQESVLLPAPKGAGIVWFWCGLAVTALVSGFSYVKLFHVTNKMWRPFFEQQPTFFVGVWSAVLGLVTILIMVLSYIFYHKKQGKNASSMGISIGFKPLLKTIAMALIVVCGAFLLVFFADYFFKTDFRFWVIAIKAFTPDKVGIALKYLPFFLIFYIANAMAINGFNNVAIFKKEWMNTALMAVFNGLGPLVIVAIQYITFHANGEAHFANISNIIGIWLFPIVVILPVAAIVSKKIFRETHNPYLAGIINAIVVTLMTCSNTLTQI